MVAGGFLVISLGVGAAQPAAPQVNRASGAAKTQDAEKGTTPKKAAVKAEEGKTPQVATVPDGKTKTVRDTGKNEIAVPKKSGDDQTTSASQAVQVTLPPVWGRDWKAARGQSEREKRPMLTVFGVSAFGPGQKVIADVLAKSEVIETLKKDYVLVYLEAQEVPEMVRELRIGSFPMAILTHADGTELGRFTGVRPRPEDFLDRVAAARKTGEELRVLNAAIEAAPQDATLQKQKGALLLAQNDPMSAMAAYRQAFLLDPQNVQDIPEQVLEILKAEQKVRELKDRIRQEPKNAALYRELGALMVKYERPGEANAAFEQALRLEPAVKEGIPDVFAREIEAKLAWEQQLKTVEDQLAKAPEDATLLRQRGDLLAGNGLTREVEEMKRAMTDYRKVMQLAAEKGADLAADVAFLEIVTKRDREPRAMVDDLVAFEKAHPQSRRAEMALYIRALALFQAESLQEGAQALREYQKRYPQGQMAQEAQAMLSDLQPAPDNAKKP
jgi:hypothetical protein